MPIYEYQCTNCKGIFEEWMKSSQDASEVMCPECGSAAERIVSQTSFVLKGGGWYVTEYGNKKTSGTQEDQKTQGGEALEVKDSTSKDIGTKESDKKDASPKEKPVVSEVKSKETKSTSSTSSASLPKKAVSSEG